MSHESLAATAQRLLAKHGRGVTFVHRSPGAAEDSEKPWATPKTPEDTPEPNKIPMAFFNYSVKRQTDTGIKVGDKFVLVALADLTLGAPKTGDYIQDSGPTDVWNVIDPGEITPGETEIVAEMQVRRP